MKCLYCGRGNDYAAGQTHEKDCEEIKQIVKELEERMKVLTKKLDWEEWIKANPDVDEYKYFDYLFDGNNLNYIPIIPLNHLHHHAFLGQLESIPLAIK